MKLATFIVIAVILCSGFMTVMQRDSVLTVIGPSEGIIVLPGLLVPKRGIITEVVYNVQEPTTMFWFGTGKERQNYQIEITLE